MEENKLHYEKKGLLDNNSDEDDDDFDNYDKIIGKIDIKGEERKISPDHEGK